MGSWKEVSKNREADSFKPETLEGEKKEADYINSLHKASRIGGNC